LHANFQASSFTGEGGEWGDILLGAIMKFLPLLSEVKEGQFLFQVWDEGRLWAQIYYKVTLSHSESPYTHV